MKTKPLSPSEVGQAQIAALPDFVIQSVNACLARTTGTIRTVKRDDIISEIQLRHECERAQIFAQRWLDFEDAFREVGWDVQYCKPDYTEDFPPYFEFRPKR